VKVLTSAQMREVDRLTIERGIPGILLMENAAMRVVELLDREFAPLSKQRVVILCGKGNNGGDGMAVARQLLHRVARLDVVLAPKPEELAGDAAANYRMLRAAGGETAAEITPEMHDATLLIDALLGTGLKGPPTGRIAEFILAANDLFPRAEVVAIDLPSGLGSAQDHVFADYTVTFTAPKPEHYLANASGAVGKLIVAQIGSPPELIQSDLEVSEARDFAGLFQPRARDAHKGHFGHVLVIGGAAGKTGAASMAGLGALRAGAGLVTVASEGGVMAPELMTEPLREFQLSNKTVVAIGPGLGLRPELVRSLFEECPLPMVVDADGLNSLAGSDFKSGGPLRVLTPHPGEMARLLGRAFEDRLETARSFAKQRNVILVLKGHNTIVTFPDGRAAINPSGTPALAKGGAGDVLTGMIAGLIAQFPNQAELAVRAGVWLHGRAAELIAAQFGDKFPVATDIFHALPWAMHECAASV
jgi:NAD(P)H-hydrate epimerase